MTTGSWCFVNIDLSYCHVQITVKYAVFLSTTLHVGSSIFITTFAKNGAKISCYCEVASIFNEAFDIDEKWHTSK